MDDGKKIKVKIFKTKPPRFEIMAQPNLEEIELGYVEGFYGGAGDGKSIEKVDGALTIKGYDEASNGQIFTKGESGAIWVDPITELDVQSIVSEFLLGSIIDCGTSVES